VASSDCGADHSSRRMGDGAPCCHTFPLHEVAVAVRLSLRTSTVHTIAAFALLDSDSDIRCRLEGHPFWELFVKMPAAVQKRTQIHHGCKKTIASRNRSAWITKPRGAGSA
jgi:hypothetical protein